MSYVHPEALVTTDWLAAHLADADLRLVDGSFKLPGITPTAREDHDRQHLPGAVFFDIDDIAEPGTSLPHMIPSAERFAQKIGALGIGDGDRVVVYDSAGLSSAGRPWWMLRLFGHEQVAILDGGLPRWREEARPLANGRSCPPARRFTARFDPSRVRDKAALLANLSSRREQVIDARACARFEGSAPEPRGGLRSGHVPMSRNLPYDRLTDPETHRLRSADELRALFGEVGVALDCPVVASCGSGVTACALAFALHLIGTAGRRSMTVPGRNGGCPAARRSKPAPRRRGEPP